MGSEELREIYRQTKIVRKPTYGIISGYHTLPYVCLGTSEERISGTTQVKGKVHVSPRFIIRPADLEPSYDEIFGGENVDTELTGRIFGFMGFKGKPVECKSENLEVKLLEIHVEDALARTLDELERQEDITTGVIITPNSRYYPVSIERFIASILDDEFSL
ncbi:MAG TPA: hypothetical protein PLJ47_13775 [Candidatus Hydrogenedentes bacterium]|nr:hypothetical protein [Candidatus Hydrogenedentota bacterium]